jgi:four helix bundle protein
MSKDPKELECWRLADALRSEVIAICAQDRVREHYRFCDGFMDAAGSVCRNISEGYGRFHSSFIVQFFGYALASLREVGDYLQESATRKYIDTARLQRDLDLAEHTKATTLKFMRYHERKLEEERRRKKGSRVTRSPHRP